MANVYFWDVQSRQRELKMVHAKATIGASGAVTLVTAASLGVASITKTSTGLYQITLSDKYTSLVDCQIMQLNAAVDTITSFQLKAEDVDGAKTVDFFTKAATSSIDTTPVVADPATASTLYITLLLKNTSV